MNPSTRPLVILVSAVAALAFNLLVVACGGRVAPGPAEDIDAGPDGAAPVPTPVVDATAPPYDATVTDGGSRADTGSRPDAAADAAPPPFMDATASEAGTDAPLDAPSDSPDDSPSCDAGLALANGICVPEDAGLLSSDECLLGGNRLFVVGDPDSRIYTGYELIVNGWWATPDYGPASGHSLSFEVHVAPSPDAGVPWDLWEIVMDGPDSSLQTGVVYDVGDAGSGAYLEVQYTSGCYDPSGPSSRGAFRVDELDGDPDAGVLRSATVAFWQQCTGYTGMVRGCIHYAAP